MSTFVITTPVVFDGIFLSTKSSLVIFLTSIFNPSMKVVLDFVGFSALKSSEVSNLPKVIFFVISFLSLQIFTSTTFPTFVYATINGSSCISLIFLPSNSRIISPSFIPALSDGLPGATLATNAPRAFFNFSTSAISFVTV